HLRIHPGFEPGLPVRREPQGQPGDDRRNSATEHEGPCGRPQSAVRTDLLRLHDAATLRQVGPPPSVAAGDDVRHAAPPSGLSVPGPVASTHLCRAVHPRPAALAWRRKTWLMGHTREESVMATSVLRSCNLCEAGCGLVFEVEDNAIVSVRADANDPQSHGFICPKGVAIADIHRDPERVRRPLRRGADGHFQEISWDDALALAGSRLRAIRAQHGADAIAVYFGNPLVHNYSGIIMLGSFLNALGTRNRTGAGSQDTSPRFAASYYLYGNTLVMPVPDIDRTDYFLCVGA